MNVSALKPIHPLISRDSVLNCILDVFFKNNLVKYRSPFWQLGLHGEELLKRLHSLLVESVSLSFSQGNFFYSPRCFNLQVMFGTHNEKPYVHHLTKRADTDPSSPLDPFSSFPPSRPPPLCSSVQAPRRFLGRGGLAVRQQVSLAWRETACCPRSCLEEPLSRPANWETVPQMTQA